MQHFERRKGGSDSVDAPGDIDQKDSEGAGHLGARCNGSDLQQNVAVAEPFAFVRLMGDPRGKGRPRTRVVGEFATIFTDAKTRKYENDLKAVGIEAMAGRPPFDGAVAVVIYAYMPVPKSWSAKKRAAAIAGDIMPTTGIDLDNIEKMLDGLNYHPPRWKGDREKRPIIWHNDSQIVSMQAIKFYSDRPRLEITVWKWG